MQGFKKVGQFCSLLFVFGSNDPKHPIPLPPAHKNRRINPTSPFVPWFHPHRLDSSINSNLFPPSYFRSYAATEKANKKSGARLHLLTWRRRRRLSLTSLSQIGLSDDASSLSLFFRPDV